MRNEAGDVFAQIYTHNTVIANNGVWRFMGGDLGRESETHQNKFQTHPKP